MVGNKIASQALCEDCAKDWGLGAPGKTGPLNDIDKVGGPEADHSIHYIGPDPGKCRGCGIDL